MAYITDNDGRTVWSYRERDEILDYRFDPFRQAAEQFARRVEEYLYDTASPVYRDDIYLAWAVGMYDIEKSGSGRYADTRTYDPATAAKQVVPPLGQRRHKSQMDVEPRLTPAARTLLSKDLDA